MKLKDYLIFFRWKNILLIILIQVLIKFVLFQKYNLTVSLDIFHFILLVLSTVFIAIGGYVINDINDIKADEINKPELVFVGKKLPLKKANNLFLIFNSLGLLIGFYFTIYIQKNSCFIIYIIVSLLLYRYSTNLKNKFLIGNLIVSVVLFLCILIVPVFDLVPAANSLNREVQIHVFKIVLGISIFAFFMTLIREVVKDMIDVKGDKKVNANTFPISIGIKKTKIFVFLLSVLTLMALYYVAYSLYPTNRLVSVYLFLIVGSLLLLFVFKFVKANTTKDFYILSNLLKIIMLYGILTTLFL